MQSVIISGANQGLGFAIAQSFVKAGAHVCICARDAQLLALAKEKLVALATSKQQIIAMCADIAMPGAFKQVVDATISQIGYLDTLIANAGVHGAIGPVDDVDWDEWTQAIEINVKGTVLQCRAVIQHFKERGGGKIILLSGGGATKPMPFMSAYAASKAAVVRFGETLAQELLPYAIDVNCVAPGALNTRLLENVLAAGPDKAGDIAYLQAVQQKENGGESLELAANLCLFLASPASNGITGRLISAKWDDWQNLPRFIKELQSSDIYTLRRITPADRDLDLEPVT